MNSKQSTATPLDASNIMKLLILTLLMLSLPSYACTLDGVWKSHKKRTLAELYGSRITNSEKMKLAKVYGKAVIEYSNCNTKVVRYNGGTTTSTFEIIEDSHDSVVVKDVPSGDMTLLVKYDNCYKIPVKGMAFYEHYCRL